MITACVWSGGSYRSRLFASSGSKPEVVLSSVSFAFCLESWTLTGMKSVFLHIAALNVVCDRSFQHWFFHCVQENAMLFRELTRQLAERFIALYYFHGVFVHGVVKLSFTNKFFSNLWLLYVFKYDFHVPKPMSVPRNREVV